GSARPGLALSRVFDERDHPTSVALRGLADRTDEPLVRWNLVRWLGNPVTARAAARGFHRLRDASAYAETLVDGHLLLAPRRRRLLRTAARPLQCLPELAEAIKLPFRSQAWLPELVLRLDISARSRVGMLADMIALPSPVARIKCVAALLTQSPDRTAATLETFAHDRAGVVARLAMHGLVGCGRLPDDQLERLEATPHPAIRTRARRTLLARSAASYFTRWLLVPEAVRVAAGRRMLAEERGPFLAGLQRCLAEGGEAGLAAIMLVRRFRLERAVTAALCRAASAGDARLASAAVAALPAAGGDDATRRVEAALEEEVRPRVRANAVEAIARMMAREAVHRLAPWIDNPDNRVRANAIRALRRYDDGRAAPALRRMLDDGDPLHRVSGIWVARTTRDPAIRGRLRTMAMTDPHGEIRTRARRAALLLDAD
ncbi:MAG: hypothetical protein HKO59_13915, partial [Phycisphaerales bacterium]|nr:hypothetical protein [Phycisphaerales bacterium]